MLLPQVGKRVFAAGILNSTTDTVDATIRAYDAINGNLPWKDQVAGGANWFQAVAAGGSRVFTTGFHAASWGTQDLGPLLRAYSAASGNLEWKIDDDPSFIGQALAVDGTTLFVGGFGEEGNSVRAYNARDGTLKWKDKNPHTVAVNKIAVSSGRVFVAGSDFGFPKIYFTVKAYDAATGELLWEDNYENGVQADALDMAKVNGRVVAVGSNSPESSSIPQFLVRSYAAETGALVWQDVLPAESLATVVTASQHRIFVGGSAGAVGSQNYIVRAYATR
jgi:outer membrane protein assembly factor BamB